MKKTAFTLCIALSIFMCNSVFVLAAVCSGSPDGVHHYTKCADAGAGKLRDGGSHLYLDGMTAKTGQSIKNVIIFVIIGVVIMYVHIVILYRRVLSTIIC